MLNKEWLGLYCCACDVSPTGRCEQHKDTPMLDQPSELMRVQTENDLLHNAILEALASVVEGNLLDAIQQLKNAPNPSEAFLNRKYGG